MAIDVRLLPEHTVLGVREHRRVEPFGCHRRDQRAKGALDRFHPFLSIRIQLCQSEKTPLWP